MVSSPSVIYPDSDGQPMADNTLQFRWIVLFKENLECLFRDNSEVFVAGDLLWYPMEGYPEIRVAPDVMVALGRPKGERGSYRQWEENDIAPQVVFEILSPGNRLGEMVKKFKFYDRYGIEEYYIYDPDRNELSGFTREESGLNVVEEINQWVSPRLGIRFELNPDELVVYYPNDERFKSTVELAQQLEQTQQELLLERQRASQETERAEQERQRAERLSAYLRSQGIDPQQIP
ncbi:Uma2 family endonuclease [Gloeomargarita lithophora]